VECVIVDLARIGAPIMGSLEAAAEHCLVEAVPRTVGVNRMLGEGSSSRQLLDFSYPLYSILLYTLLFLHLFVVSASPLIILHSLPACSGTLLLKRLTAENKVGATNFHRENEA
jgi:hypothetical protein